MKPAAYIALGLLTFFASCSSHRTEYAIKWTNDIKAKILADAGDDPDSLTIENKVKGYQLITTFRDTTRLYQFLKEKATGDTLWITWYSKDQNFSLGKEMCALHGNKFYVELIFFKDTPLGQHTFYYCNGKIKRQGFNIGGQIGHWRDYDENGQLTKDTNYGNEGRLDTLRNVKYWR